MIKINLHRGRPQGTGVGTSPNTAGTGTMPTEFNVTSAEPTADFNKRDAVVNGLMLVVFPILLMFYEQHHIDQLNLQLRQTQSALSVKETTLQEKKAEAAKSGELKEKAKELANKIEILKKLAKIRLREIRALDFIQNNIPEKVWLSEMVFKEGQLKLKGRSMTDDDLTNFVNSLENSKYFTNVLLLQAREERLKEAALKTFEVSCNLEVE